MLTGALFCTQSLFASTVVAAGISELFWYGNPGSGFSVTGGVLQISASSGYTTVAAPFPNITFGNVTSVTVRLLFRQSAGSGGFRVGLFNDNGTVLDGNDGTFDTETSDDPGLWVVFTSTQSRPRYEEGTSGAIFMASGTNDRFADDSSTQVDYPFLGSSSHAVVLTYFIGSSGKLNVTANLDGTDLFTSSFNTTGDSFSAGLNEIAFVNDSSSGTQILQFDDIEITAVTPPPRLYLITISSK
jgi:hypothetical protein